MVALSGMAIDLPSFLCSGRAKQASFDVTAGQQHADSAIPITSQIGMFAIISQGCVSGAHLTVTAVTAWALGQGSAFDTFAMQFALYLVMVGIGRALVGEIELARGAFVGGEHTYVLLCGGFALGSVMVDLLAGADRPTTSFVVSGTVAILYDHSRYKFFADRNLRDLAKRDAYWFAVVVATTPAAWLSIDLYLLMWASVPTMLLLISGRRIVSRTPVGKKLKANSRDVRIAFLLDHLLLALVTSGMPLWVGLLGRSDLSGRIRLVQSIFAPAALLVLAFKPLMQGSFVLDRISSWPLTKGCLLSYSVVASFAIASGWLVGANVAGLHFSGTDIVAWAAYGIVVGFLTDMSNSSRKQGRMGASIGMRGTVLLSVTVMVGLVNETTLATVVIAATVPTIVLSVLLFVTGSAPSMYRGSFQ